MAAKASKAPATRSEPPESWVYAPAPESAEIVSIASEYGLFVNGEFAPAQDGKQLITLNPATEAPLAALATANPGLMIVLMIASRSSNGANALFIALIVSHWRSAQP